VAQRDGAAPLLRPFFPARTLEAFRKRSGLVSTLLEALPFTFQTHRLIFMAPEQPSQDPSERINSRAVPAPCPAPVKPSSLLTAAPSAAGEARGPRLAGEPALPPFQVKVLEAKGATETPRPAAGAVARTASRRGAPPGRLPSPTGPGGWTRRGPAGRPGVGRGAGSGPGHRAGGCWGHSGGAGRAGDEGGRRGGGPRGDPAAGTERARTSRGGRAPLPGGEAQAEPPLLYSPPRPAPPGPAARRRTARRYHTEPRRRRHVTTPPGSHRAGMPRGAP